MTRHFNYRPVKDDHPLKRVNLNGKPRWNIDGKDYSMQSLLTMAKGRGFDTTAIAIRRRLDAGIRDIETLIAEPKRRSETVKRAQKKRDEMAAIIANMAPSRRY